MKKEDVVGGMLAYIAHLREVGRYSTAKSYLDALRSFKCFCGMEEIPYAYIDLSLIHISEPTRRS